MDGDERRARNLQEQRRNREKAAADKAQKQAADRERQQRSRAANRGAANPSAADGPGGTGIGASAVASAVAVAPWASAALPPGNLHATDDRERELSETLTLSDSGHGAGGGTTRAAAGAAATSSASISAPSGDKPGTIVSGAVVSVKRHGHVGSGATHHNVHGAASAAATSDDYSDGESMASPGRPLRLTTAAQRQLRRARADASSYGPQVALALQTAVLGGHAQLPVMQPFALPHVRMPAAANNNNASEAISTAAIAMPLSHVSGAALLATSSTSIVAQPPAQQTPTSQAAATAPDPLYSEVSTDEAWETLPLPSLTGVVRCRGRGHEHCVDECTESFYWDSADRRAAGPCPSYDLYADDAAAHAACAACVQAETSTRHMLRLRGGYTAAAFVDRGCAASPTRARSLRQRAHRIVNLGQREQLRVRLSQLLHVRVRLTGSCVFECHWSGCVR